MTPSIVSVLFAALAAALFYGCLGAAVSRGLRLRAAIGLSLAPALGWAVFTATALPLQEVFGFSRISTAVFALLALAVAVLALRRQGRAAAPAGPVLPPWAFGLAALIALIPLLGILPKTVPDGLILGPPAFDHSKVAMVDEMTRLGLPAGNPFFGAAGTHATLSYYYLWHFSAAQLSSLTGLSGWAADAAMTGVTAFASLLLMMSLALRMAGRLASERPPSDRAATPAAPILWVAALSLTGTLRPLLGLLLGPDRAAGLLADYRGVAGWMVQASWVPQHMASAVCVVLAVLVLLEVRARPSPGLVLLLGALAAAAFGSSAWVGGVTFALAGAAVGVVALARPAAASRASFLLAVVAAAAVAAVLALPLLAAESASLGARGGGAPIGLHPYEIFGPWVPDGVRRALDLPAFWLLLLPLDLPAIFPAGLAAAWLVLRRRPPAEDAAEADLLGLTVLALAGLAVAWLLISTIGNNDLGWRAVLPAVLVFTPWAAAGLSHWIRVRAVAPAAAALALVATSLPDPQIQANLFGRKSDDAEDFAKSPQMWAAVRRYAGPVDRVANNPQYLDDLTDWPVNPSWALLSDRPSCFSGWETARAYVDLPADRITALDAQFTRVFDGKGNAEDVRQMAQVYDCRVVVVVEGDGAWAKDPFAASPLYRLAETQPGAWRIYVAATPSTR